jgi:hypothetical protein
MRAATMMSATLATALTLIALLTTPAYADPPKFGEIALGTPQDLVLLGREGVKLVASDGTTTSIRADYSETLETGDKVSGEEVFHFREGVLVGGDRRIRVRKGKENREFFWRTYIFLRVGIAKDCSADLVTHEPYIHLTWNDLISAGGAFVQEDVWRGRDHWSARCDGPKTTAEVRMQRDGGSGDKPTVVLSVHGAEDEATKAEKTASDPTP